MSLYQKYRPKTLDEVRGNETLIKNIRGHFAKPEHNHCILFTGDSGCGKSTLAYIIAKQVLGAADSCIHEVNASSNTENGVDAVVSLIERSKRPPLMPPVNVFIFNECQGLTQAAKAALLDPTENCPSYTYFIFTTTNRDKFFRPDKGEKKNALSTRCTEFAVTPLDERDAMGLITDIAEAEGFRCSDKVVDAIVSNSDGSGRLIVTNLETCMALEDEDDMVAAIAKVETSEDPDLVALCKELMPYNPKATTSWSAVAGILKKVKEKGTEPESVRRMVASWASTKLLKNYDKHTFKVLVNFSGNNTYDTGFPQLVAICASCVG